MINKEKSAVVSVLIEKITFYKNITSKTYICYKQFLSNNVLKIFEISSGFSELEYIQNLISCLEKDLNNDEKSIDDLLNDLQNINDKLSIIIKQYGTDNLDDLLVICLGNDYIKDNILNNENIVKYYRFLSGHSNVISYEIITNNIDDNNNKKIRIKNIDNDNSSFYMKIFGYQLILNNIENNQSIIINCIFKDIPVNYVTDNILSDKINNIQKDKPNNENFNGDIFVNFIESLSIKTLMVNKLQDIYEMFLGSISNSLNAKNKLLSKLMREFLNMDLYSQRQMIIDLLIDTDDHEGKYIAYLLYDLLSCDVNSSIDSNDQMIIYNSFPNKVQQSFKYAMKSTIDYTKKLMDSDLESKLPLEQRICLLKTTDIVKEKAMIKVKELRSKSDDSSSKVRHYLEGLLKIPFGIFRKEKILYVIDNIIQNINKNKDEYVKLDIIPDKQNITNVDILTINKNFESTMQNTKIQYVKNYLYENNKVDIVKKITKYNANNTNKITIESKGVKKLKLDLLKYLNDENYTDTIINIFANKFDIPPIITEIKTTCNYISNYIQN